MEILLILISFLIFLYTLFNLVKDDYVCIRKNISPENVFDIAFVVFIFNFLIGSVIEFSFPILFLITISLLYLMTKYKKFPIGRIFDFFIFSFLFSLPFSFFLSAILYSGSIIFYLVQAAFYLILLIIFIKFLKNKLMSRKIREGTISIVFIVIFSLESFVAYFFQKGASVSSFFQRDSLLWILLISLSIVLLVVHWILRVKTDKR